MGWSLIPVCSTNLATSSRENISIKLAYSAKTTMKALSWIKKAIWTLQEGWTSELTRETICTIKILLSGSIVIVVNN